MLNKRILVLMFLLLFLPLVGCLTPSNQAPILTSSPITTATVGVLYTYDMNATDPNGDTLTYSLVAKPTNMTINSATGLIKWTPVATQFGNNSVTVKVSDGTLSITQGFIIKVSKPTPTPINHEPVIYSTPVTTATVGVTYFYDVNATDPDGDTLTYSLTTKPSGMAINPTNGLIWWTPTTKGNYAVVVNVSDGALSDTQGFTIVVSKPTVPLETYTITASAGTGGTISPLGDVTVNKGANISFTITPNTNYNVADVLVDGGSVGAVASYTFTNVAKNHTIHATFNVIEVELTEIVVLPETMTLLKGGSQLITSVTAHYGDGTTVGIALGNCTYSSSATNVATVSNGLVFAVAKGTATITVIYMGKSDTIAVTVSEPTPVNHAPIITPIPGLTAILGVTFTYDVEATDPDNDVLTYSLTVKPIGMSISSTTGVISWIPNATGSYDVTVKVSDGELSDTQPFTITVVTVEITGIEVEPDTMTLFVGVSETIGSVTAKYEIKTGFEANIDLEDCTYTSSAPGVATVDAGVVTGEATGGATITVTYAGKSDTIVVAVSIHSSPVHNVTQDTYYTTIQTAIDDADPDDVIEVAAGMYTENLVIDKQLTLQGAGSTSTIIDASGGTPGILLEAGGVSATQRMVIKDLRITGSTDGIRAYKVGGFNLDYVTLENLLINLNGDKGVELHNGVVVTDMEIKNCEFINNGGPGLRASSATPVNGLTITNSHLDSNKYGGYLCGGVLNLIVSHTTMNGNSERGWYCSEIGKITNIKFENCEANDNGLRGITIFTYNAEGIDGVEIRNTEIKNNLQRGFHIGAATTHAENVPSPINNVLVEDCDILNNGNGPETDKAGFHLDIGELTNVVVHNCNIIGNNEFGVYNADTYSSGVVDATENWWGDASGPFHTTNPLGKGDAVSDTVDYEHFLPSQH